MSSVAVEHGVPSVLNLGGGQHFDGEALNLDPDRFRAADAVLDLGTVTLGPEGLEIETKRFGVLRLRPGRFRRIVARSVLERTPDLVRLMTTCLALLETEGLFDISVAYDLSLGAWQDPSHVRGFNELSFRSFTDLFRALGWTEARFVLDELAFVPSALGETLRARGMAPDEINRTPRAIDAMRVVLRKVALSQADRAASVMHGIRRPAPMPRVEPVLPSAAAAPSGPRPFDGPWATLKNRYCLWIVSPKGYTHHQAFDDVAGALSGAFASLGGTAPVVHHPSEWRGRLPIVLAPQLLTPTLGLVLPPGSILFNMEQVDRGSVWMNETYMGLLKRHAVLDYSERNAAALRAAGIGHAEVLPIGYDASLERLPPAAAQDIDVLFYGSMNARRATVLNDLLARGVKVMHAFDCYGADRDALVARARIVLNLHYYESAIFESVRVSLLLANGACVVTEGDPDDPDLADIRDGMAVCGYSDLVATCLALLANEPLRRGIAEHGYRSMVARPQAVSLQTLIEGQRADSGPMFILPNAAVSFVNAVRGR